jgi:hypothetical protein
MDKIATDVWVVFSSSGTAPVFLGAYETKEKADADAKLWAKRRRKVCVKNVMLIAFGVNRETGAVYSNDCASVESSDLLN